MTKSQTAVKYAVRDEALNDPNRFARYPFVDTAVTDAGNAPRERHKTVFEIGWESGNKDRLKSPEYPSRNDVEAAHPDFTTLQVSLFLNGYDDGRKADTFRLTDFENTTENLKELIRLMVYAPLTERLRLSEQYAGPFELIEAKLPDKLPNK